MARPQKEGLDYFPLDVSFLEDIKVRKIKKSFGANSISILVCLLCSIYRDSGYYIGWNEDNAFLIAETVGVTEGVVNEVINKALQVDFFNEQLYKKYKILTSKGIQKRFSFVVKSSKLAREKINPKYDLLSEENAKSSEEIEESSEETAKNTEESTQRKEKKSKANESKENNKGGALSRFLKPTFEEVDFYCKERSNNINAQRFIDFYESKGWKVGNQPMKDWRAAVRTWEARDAATQKSPSNAIDNVLAKIKAEEEFL